MGDGFLSHKAREYFNGGELIKPKPHRGIQYPDDEQRIKVNKRGRDVSDHTDDMIDKACGFGKRHANREFFNDGNLEGGFYDDKPKRVRHSRGYEAVREKEKGYPKAYMNCLACNHYYSVKPEGEEVCNNNGVSEFDLVLKDTTIFCLYWEVVSSQEKKKYDKVEGRRRQVLNARRDRR